MSRAAPMDDNQRSDNYVRQMGGWKYTPAQRRRYWKKFSKNTLKALRERQSNE